MRSWTRDEDEELRESYNDKVHVSPAQIAVYLHRKFYEVVQRMSELGIRSRRCEERW